MVVIFDIRLGKRKVHRVTSTSTTTTKQEHNNSSTTQQQLHKNKNKTRTTSKWWRKTKTFHSLNIIVIRWKFVVSSFRAYSVAYAPFHCITSSRVPTLIERAGENERHSLVHLTLDSITFSAVIWFAHTSHILLTIAKQIWALIYEWKFRAWIFYYHICQSFHF